MCVRLCAVVCAMAAMSATARVARKCVREFTQIYMVKRMSCARVRAQVCASLEGGDVGGGAGDTLLCGTLVCARVYTVLQSKV